MTTKATGNERLYHHLDQAGGNPGEGSPTVICHHSFSCVLVE
jgi:hypothetical protein